MFQRAREKVPENHKMHSVRGKVAKEMAREKESSAPALVYLWSRGCHLIFLLLEEPLLLQPHVVLICFLAELFT